MSNLPKGYVYIGKVVFHQPCKWNYCPHCKPDAFKKIKDEK